MKNKLAILLAFGVCVGCALKKDENTNAVAVQEKIADDNVVAANTAFAFDLYHQLQPDEKGNLFFSPYNISNVLAMTYAGARENTAAQMSQVLHFAPDQTRFHPAFGELQASVNATGTPKDSTLNVANGLWVHKRYSFHQSFLDLLQRYYQAEPKSVDFKASEEVRQQINAWVKGKTNDKISNLIKPGKLTPFSRLVLVNAIYFKSDWDEPFDSDDTKDTPFWVTPHESVEVPMMFQKNYFNYLENDHLQILELPYKRNELSMIVLLPRERDGLLYSVLKQFAQYQHEGLKNLEKTLTQKLLADWLSKLQKQKIKVYLPKFKMTSEFELSNTLKEMGMSEAFNKEAADFSGMADLPEDEKLVISKAIQKTFVEVNESGTEATAATFVEYMAVGAAAGNYQPPPVPIFRADHPFLFLIRHNSTGSILFLGRVVNPL